MKKAWLFVTFGLKLMLTAIIHSYPVAQGQKTGGMDIVLYQREDGQIYTAMKIFCRADGPNLKTEIWVGGKKTNLKIETMR